MIITKSVHIKEDVARVAKFKCKVQLYAETAIKHFACNSYLRHTVCLTTNQVC